MATAWKYYHLNRNVQLAMSATAILLAITTLATGANTVRVYNQNRHSNAWWLPIWPDHFEIGGARSLMGASGTALLLHAIYLSTSLLPKLNLKESPTISALNTCLVTFLTSAIAVMALVYAHVLNRQSPASDTIQTWTCRFHDSKSVDGSPKMDNITNRNFGSLCAQSQYAIWGVLVIFILQALMFLLAIVGLIREKLSKRKVRKSGASSPDGSLELVGTGFATDKHPVLSQRAY